MLYAITKTIDEKLDGYIALVVGSVEIYLPLAELVDPAEERARQKDDELLCQQRRS